MRNSEEYKMKTRNNINDKIMIDIRKNPDHTFTIKKRQRRTQREREQRPET